MYNVFYYITTMLITLQYGLCILIESPHALNDNDANHAYKSNEILPNSTAKPVGPSCLWPLEHTHTHTK